MKNKMSKMRGILAEFNACPSFWIFPLLMPLNEFDTHALNLPPNVQIITNSYLHVSDDMIL
jgi:hypothetical protein